MMTLSIFVSLVLVAVAAIHALWGFGVWFPIRDEEALARTVVGARGVTRMPGPIPCFLVVGGIAIVVGAIWLPYMLLSRIVLWIAAFVFLGRGAMTYTRLWRKMTPEEPFATYDRTRYAPLCLGLGVGLILIVIGG